MVSWGCCHGWFGVTSHFVCYFLVGSGTLLHLFFFFLALLHRGFCSSLYRLWFMCLWLYICVVCVFICGGAVVFRFCNQTWPQEPMGKLLPGGGSSPSLPLPLCNSPCNSASHHVTNMWGVQSPMIPTSWQLTWTETKCWHVMCSCIK